MDLRELLTAAPMDFRADLHLQSMATLPFPLQAPKTRRSGEGPLARLLSSIFGTLLELPC